MGRYFDNEILDGLWTRLVTRTEEIVGVPLSNTGIKGIHDVLLSHYDLLHENTPTTPGDYMKGISVAANYHTNNNQVNTATENTLKRIVDRLEHSCYLSDDMVLTINGWFHLSGFRLIDADTEEELCYIDSGSSSNYDIKDYYDSFQNGKRYYAIADLTMEENIEADQPPDIWYYNIRSNEVVFGGESTGGWKLTNLTDYANSYNMRIADGYLLVDGDPWAVFDNDDNFIATLYSDTPVDLSSLNTGKSYYVGSAPAGEPTPGNADARLVYETEGGASDETDSWVLEVVPGSKPGNIWLEGGYLYTDGEFGYYVQEQNWTTSKVYFYPGEPLDLSTLDKNLTYRVEDGDVYLRWGTLWYER